MSTLRPESPVWPRRKIQAYYLFARMAAGLLLSAGGTHSPNYYPDSTDTYLGIRTSRAALGTRDEENTFIRAMSIAHYEVVTPEFEEISGKHLTDFVSLETYVLPRPSYPEAVHLHEDGELHPYRSAFAPGQLPEGYPADPDHGLARALGVVVSLVFGGDEQRLIDELDRSLPPTTAS